MTMIWTNPFIFEDSNEIEGWYAVDDLEHINALMQMVDLVCIVFTDGRDVP